MGLDKIAANESIHLNFYFTSTIQIRNIRLVRSDTHSEQFGEVAELGLMHLT